MRALIASVLVIGLLNFDLSCCCADSWLLASGSHQHATADNHDPSTPHPGHGDQTHACYKAGGSRFVTQNAVQLIVIYETTPLPWSGPVLSLTDDEAGLRKSMHYWSPRDYYSLFTRSMRLLI